MAFLILFIILYSNATLIQEKFIPLRDIYVNNYSEKETLSNIEEREVNTFAELVNGNELEKTRFYYECSLDYLNDIENRVKTGEFSPVPRRLCHNPLFLFSRPRSLDLNDTDDFSRLFYRKYTAIVDDYY